MSKVAEKPRAPATERNRSAILDILRIEFEDRTSVLEIGSGTGQHAVYFGRELRKLRWQTSDRAGNHAGIEAWVNDAGLENVHLPMELDVERVTTVPGTFDAVFSANTAHIMSFKAVTCMFQLVGSVLSQSGIFCLYGPFNVDGEFTSESNRTFDQSLRQQEPSMGIRDLEAINDLGLQNGLQIKHRYAMPANNMLVSWQKQ